MMRLMVFCVVGLSLFISILSAQVQDKDEYNAGIVYGSDLAVTVLAPKGWILDNESGVAQGLHAVFYPEGSSWAKSTEVMYVSIAKIKPGVTLPAFIADDIDSFKKDAPNLRVEKENPIEMKNGTQAYIRNFSGDKYGNYECIAYAQKDSSVAIYVLSCKNKEGFVKSVEAFKEMVRNSILMAVVLK